MGEFTEFQKLNGYNYCTLYDREAANAGDTIAGPDAFEAGFGESLALSADCLRLVVGAPSDATILTDEDILGTKRPVGAAYVFSRPNIESQFEYEERLLPSDSGTYSAYGYGTAISGDGLTIAIGAPFTGYTTIQTGEISYAGSNLQGAIYIYNYDGGWSEQDAFGGGEGAGLGRVLKLSPTGDDLLVMNIGFVEGDFFGNQLSPVYHYKRINDSWQLTGTIGTEGRWVDVNSDWTMMVIGNAFESSFTVFSKGITENEWNELGTITHGGGGHDEANIGGRVSISDYGDVVVASGTTSVAFTTPDNWGSHDAFILQESEIQEAGEGQAATVIAELAPSGETIITGMPGHDSPSGEDGPEVWFAGRDAGRAKFHQRVEGNWEDVLDYFRPGNMHRTWSDPGFGYDVDIQNGFAVIGAYLDGAIEYTLAFAGGITRIERVGQVWIYETPFVSNNIQYWGSVVNLPAA